MPTNVRKLHELIDKLEKHPEGWFWRGVGKTTLQIHKLAGQIQVGYNDKIIVQIKFERDLQYLWPRLKEIFAEQGIEIIRVRWRGIPVVMDVEFDYRDIRLFFIPRGETSNDLREYQQRTRGYNCLEFSLIDY